MDRERSRIGRGGGGAVARGKRLGAEEVLRWVGVTGVCVRGGGGGEEEDRIPSAIEW